MKVFLKSLNNKADYHRSLGKNFLLTIFELAGTLLSIWLFVKYCDKGRITFIPLKQRRYKDIALGLLISFLIMVVGFGVLLLGHQIGRLTVNFNLGSIALTIGLFLNVAIMEEVLVRGFILKKLLHYFSDWVALSVSAVIFSLMHIFNAHIGVLPLIDLFLAGVLLGLPYMLTKNLSCSIAMHFSWNFFQCLLGFNVSGSTWRVLITQGYKTDNIYTGGAFGFEGSLLCIILQIVAIMAIRFLFSNTRKNEVGQNSLSVAALNQ